MRLFALRAELAVMNILSEHRLRENEELPFVALNASWRRYGLRERDLPHALSRLKEMRLIELHRNRGQRSVMLTSVGTEWLRSMRGRVTRLLLLPRYLRAQVAQFVAPGAADDHPDRRSTDHPRREA